MNCPDCGSGPCVKTTVCPPTESARASEGTTSPLSAATCSCGAGAGKTTVSGDCTYCGLPRKHRTHEQRVRERAERYHTTCGGNDEPVEEAFCDCWGRACGEVGPCGECYMCRPGGLNDQEATRA